MRPEEWQTIGEIVDAARDVLPAGLLDGVSGGAGRELTLRRNTSALELFTLMPRVLRGVGEADLRTPLLGHTLSLPVVLAPIGEVVRFHPDGAGACAAAAGAVGTATYVSVVSSPSMEEVRAHSTGPLVLQLYLFGDRPWIVDLIERAGAAGFSAICLTVDTPVTGRRDRDLRNRLQLPPQARPNLGTVELPPYRGDSFTWDDLAWLRGASELPLILKGILHPDDARIAVEHGVDVVHVSNHGGQQLDGAPSTIEMLPEIVAAIGGRAEVVVDSGFTRGTDVIKAIALGANAVAIGKLMVYALSAGGERGVRRMLEILASEIGNSLVNMGVGSIAELGPEHVREAARL